MGRLCLSNRIRFQNSCDASRNCSLLCSSNGILGSWGRFLKAFIWFLTAVRSPRLPDETLCCLNVNTWLLHSLSLRAVCSFCRKPWFSGKKWPRAFISRKASNCFPPFVYFSREGLCFMANKFDKAIKLKWVQEVGHWHRWEVHSGLKQYRDALCCAGGW